MQFVVIAYDGTDADAPKRRLAARDAHRKNIQPLKDDGSILTGGIILDEADGMIGSVVIVDFPSRVELAAWLAADPYVTGGVWRRIEVHPFRVT